MTASSQAGRRPGGQGCTARSPAKPTASPGTALMNAVPGKASQVTPACLRAHRTERTPYRSRRRGSGCPSLRSSPRSPRSSRHGLNASSRGNVRYRAPRDPPACWPDGESMIGALRSRRWRRGRVLRPHQRVLHPAGAGHVQTPRRPRVDHLLGPAQFRHHRPRRHRARTHVRVRDQRPRPADQQPPQGLTRRAPKLPHLRGRLTPGGDPAAIPLRLGASAAISFSITARARSRSCTRPTPCPREPVGPARSATIKQETARMHGSPPPRHRPRRTDRDQPSATNPSATNLSGDRADPGPRLLSAVLDADATQRAGRPLRLGQRRRRDHMPTPGHHPATAGQVPTNQFLAHQMGVPVAVAPHGHPSRAIPARRTTGPCASTHGASPNPTTTR